MNETLIDAIKSLQLRIDASKANLENDKKIQGFIELLMENPEAWAVLYNWKNHPKPLVIVEPGDFDFFKLKPDLLSVASASHYLRDYVYSFFEQYSEVTLDNEKIKRINDFIKQARAKNFLDSKNEFLLYCSQCRKVVLTNKLEEDDKCTCGMSYDFKFSLTSISPSISQEIISGHLLELYALRIARSIEDLKLIGMEIQGEEKVVYTSIQYSDIGVGDKSNGELDLLGVKNDTIAAFECKFNETTYSDIKDFLGIADNLYYRIREKKPNLKLIKIIISYDGSKLTPSNNFFVMSIKNLISINTAIKEIKTLIH